MASVSNAVGSSNNPRSFRSIMRRTNRNKDARMPEWCACGSRPVLRWSVMDSNPGRPFVGCPNYNVDKILEEDAVTCDGRTSFSNDNEEWKMKIAWKLGRLESEVRVLKMGGGDFRVCMYAAAAADYSCACLKVG
ncbi:hypothetical protein Ahy_B02g060290 [Arachis hypogaea]|uniref:Zinc finger GRF-type domain-containing protein n=1 Tax=Arachis hypogaea TaxID=3818 RepID=A0A445AI75_ARAHY|nr:hypothetical protein Ahy_B02g060290 [Arachis hypogaea]